MKKALLFIEMVIALNMMLFTVDRAKSFLWHLSSVTYKTDRSLTVCRIFGEWLTGHSNEENGTCSHCYG